MLFSLICCLVLVLLIAGCTSPEPDVEEIPQPTPGQNQVLNFQGGSLRKVMGTPLLFISGKPYDRGYQYGVLMRNEIVKNVAYFKNLLQAMYGQYWEAFLNAVYQREYLLPTEWLEKIHGIANGCGQLDYKDILLINSMFGVTFCSSAAINIGGEYIHLKNHEFSYQEEELPYILIVEEDVQGRRMIYHSVHGPGTFIPMDGMNDRGISLTLQGMPIYQGEVDYTKGLFYMVLTYNILSQCSRMSEVEEMIASFYHRRSICYVVVSAAENLAAKFEVCPQEYGSETAKGNHVFKTNHFSIKKMQKYQHPTSFGYFWDIGTSFINGQTLCPRYNLLTSLYKDVQYARDSDTISLLRDSRYYYHLNQEYFGFLVLDVNTAVVKIDPDNVYAWLIPQYRGITSIQNHVSMIMNPNLGYMYFAIDKAYAAYRGLKKIHLLGEVNDHWNINTEKLAADPHRYQRGILFYDFLTEVYNKQRSLEELYKVYKEYMRKDPDNPIYFESYGRLLLKEKPDEAREFFKDCLAHFPENPYFIRLYGISIFEVYKSNGDSKLLDLAADVYTKTLTTLQTFQNILPGLKLDIYYRLMLVAKEQGKGSQLKKWQQEFFNRYKILGHPDFYPFSELLTAVEAL